MRGYNETEGRRILEKGFRMERGMCEYLEGGKCRRVVLDREMDGRVDRIGCENGEKLCDVCRGTVRSRRARVVVRAEGFVPSQQQRRDELLLADDSTAENWDGIAPDEESTGARSRLRSSKEDGEEAESGLGLIEVGDESDGTRSEERGLKRSRGQEADELHAEERERREEAQVRKKMRLTERASGEVGRDELAKRLDEWTKIGCSVCWAQGQIQRARSARSWKGCKEHNRGAGKRMEEVTRKIERLEMTRFSGCKFCWVPQSICQRWEEKTAAKGSKTAGFQRSRVASAGCQYRGVIVDVAGALISQRMGPGEADEGEGEEWQWLEGEMEKTIGFWEGGELGENGWGRLWRWMVRKRVTMMMETNEMVRMMYHMS